MLLANEYKHCKQADITMGLTQQTFKQSFFTFLFLLLLSGSIFAKPTILVWGDSLSAAYGIPKDKGWVNLMRKALGDRANVINGSVSGETTRGGLSRLADALDLNQPDVVILELGANDGLRGFPPQITHKNLNQMILQASTEGAQVILLGMKIPPNYGPAYSKKFESVFSNLAEEYKLPFIPFFLESVIQNRTLLQDDELHPTAQAQPLLLKAVLPTVEKTLKKELAKAG